MSDYRSWGHFPDAPHRHVEPLTWRNAIPDLRQLPGPVLPFGLGRSYGDSCLNEDGTLLDVTGLDRFIALDEARRLLRCEAGVTLEQVLALIVPRGYFLPVTPGTKYVTVGGAIANDVHGKNHHVAGTFGCHVTQFELLRSDGERLRCSPVENNDLFRATIGGLGLTGLITWAEFSLIPIRNAMIEMERIRFDNLDEFFELSARSNDSWDYSVAWLDMQIGGKQLGRGVFMRGNHAKGDLGLEPSGDPFLSVPVNLPELLLNPLTMRLFNTGYYYAQLRRRVQKVVHYEPFFYPLDAIGDWNRAYGKAGFLQYQFVLPRSDDHRVIRQLIERIVESHHGFINVFKEFGDIPSPGMLSFPRPGVTLALDFPNRGRKTLALLDELDAQVRGAGGVIYPAKDARMSAADFQRGYPQWREFSRYVDPHFSSSFWRRVTPPGQRSSVQAFERSSAQA
ncbi:MAG: FAD-binding oxidoreductase [Anaerolineales bacterium]|nr:FAD-binding oxidoreductase [Anaerolineales bacterium]MCB9128080.1 FAD-binding oxidoreductase [Ardenticatenales bacterium]MCB9172117.1 FAD-binding oxidoreductase [Ardenticatenales bacterium]